jgi:hypothetical protein
MPPVVWALAHALAQSAAVAAILNAYFIQYGLRSLFVAVIGMFPVVRRMRHPLARAIDWLTAVNDARAGGHFTAACRHVASVAAGCDERGDAAGVRDFRCGRKPTALTAENRGLAAGSYK